jgi:hypothetical protein
MSLQWATTQCDRGDALTALGEREPVDWATSQNNLRFTLEALGKRSRDPKQLEDAIRLFSSAPEIHGCEALTGLLASNRKRAGADLAQLRLKSKPA